MNSLTQNSIDTTCYHCYDKPIGELIMKHTNDSNNIKPQQITFDVTDRCQMKCVTCSKWKTNAGDVIGKELTTHEWKDIISKLRSWLGEGFWFCFSGGEPFLRGDIFELAEYAKSLNIHPSTMTNAFSIEQHYEDIMNSAIESINISLNAVNDCNIHDISRGRGGSCEKAINAILELNELKKQRNSNLSINIATIMFPENLDEVIPLVEFVTKHKLNGIMFQLLDDSESFHSYNSQKGVSTSNYKMPENLRNLYSKMAAKATLVIDRLIEMKKAGHSIYNSYEQLNALKVFFKNPDDILENIICDVGSTNFAIDPYGDVRLCFNMDPVGSVRESSPEDIWNNSKSSACRKATKKCKMYCRMLNCNFKDNYSNFNKSFLHKAKNKIRKIYKSIFSID